MGEIIEDIFLLYVHHEFAPYCYDRELHPIDYVSRSLGPAVDAMLVHIFLLLELGSCWYLVDNFS